VKRITTITTITSLFLLIGCSQEVVADQQSPIVRASADGSVVEGCSEIIEVCAMSFPVRCYSICADDPGECEPVEICTASYPPMCRTECADPGIDPDECDDIVTVSDSDGFELVACVVEPPCTGGGSEPGSPGDPEPVPASPGDGGGTPGHAP